MTSLWRCDWCQETTEEREDVVMVEFDGRPDGGSSLHVHPECLPEDVREVVAR